ncbi:phosphatidylglycerophosphatase A [Arenicellales bacterium nBUS_48]|jgi:phosphatidylglycerophosphatase A
MTNKNSVKSQLTILLAQGLGVGRIPVAPGTFGTLAGLPIVWVLWNFHPLIYVAITGLFIAFSIWIAGRAARFQGTHDDPKIVIDEIAGIMVALAWVPPSAIALAAGFILFRLLDIIKPPPINWVDRRVKGGLGIVLDDLIAGLGANIVLQIALRST